MNQQFAQPGDSPRIPPPRSLFSPLVGAAVLLSAMLASCGSAPSGNSTPVVEVGEQSSQLYVLSSVLWPRPSPTIPVCWEAPSSSHAAERQAVRDAVNETWGTEAGVHFTGWGACTTDTRGVRITVDDSHPRSQVGYSPSSPTYMWLNFYSWCTGFTGDSYWTCIKFVAVHEFGHALGFMHEQDRPDTPQWCRDQQPRSEGSADWLVGTWDVNSIMNYCNPNNYRGWRLSGTDAAAANTVYPTVGFRDLALQANGTAGYRLRGDGYIAPFGGAPAVANAQVKWPNWDIARAIALRSNGTSGYILDGFGGLHPFGGAPYVAPSVYWSGWDIARDLVLLNDNQGYVLDGFGGIHPFGGAPAVVSTAYWNGRDIANALALSADGNGGYVLDGYGGIHRFRFVTRPSFPPSVTSYAYWNGWDIARDITVNADGRGGYVLDGFGGVQAFTFAGQASPTPVVMTSNGYWNGWDIARAIRLHGRNGMKLDGLGGIHVVSISP